MICYTTTILKFNQQGEKTGWTYIVIPIDVAQKLKKGYKKSYRVKGKLDDHGIKGVALLPMGEGEFIMPLNGGMRKAIGKKHGAMLKVQLEEDKTPYVLNPDMMACLADEPEALIRFNNMPGSHQRYYSKWIETAKTQATIANRIARVVNSMLKKQTFAQMLRQKD